MAHVDGLAAPLKGVGSLARCCARGCVCIICMYAFVWVRVYFPLNPISQVSSTSAITCLARLLFLASHFYSGLGKLTTFFLILCSALFFRVLYVYTYASSSYIRVTLGLGYLLSSVLGSTPGTQLHTSSAIQYLSPHCLSPVCPGTRADW